MDILDFAREFSSFRRGKGRLRESNAEPGYGPVRLLVPARSLLRATRWQAPAVPVFGTWSALGGHAAASTFGHVWQAADRLASTRARRAAAARDVRFAGTASPVPKYISSGVCPRNAECGSTRLCS
jgi:hypothetical protein